MSTLDLFGGAGGFALGARLAGREHLLSVDTEPRACATTEANLGPALCADLADPDVRAEVVRLASGADLVVGGPPCQPFSRAGASKLRSLGCTADPRRELWRAFLDVATAVHPRHVVMENVPGIARPALDGVTDGLRAAGYEVDVLTLDASRFGVPQARVRLFVRASLGELGPPPEPGPAVPCGPALVGAPVPERVRAVRPDDLEAFRHIPQGGDYRDVPAHLRRYRIDTFVTKYYRLHPDRPAPTVTAHLEKDGYSHIHPTEHRTITTTEAARLQGFPDDFRFAGPMGAVFRQVGNAVPPPLAEAVIRSLEAQPWS